jgi:hypothetical protein
MTGGGNDGSVFLRYVSADVALGWPLRYSHSLGEVIDMKDLDELGRIIAVFGSNEGHFRMRKSCAGGTRESHSIFRRSGFRFRVCRRDFLTISAGIRRTGPRSMPTPPTTEEAVGGLAWCSASRKCVRSTEV